MIKKQNQYSGNGPPCPEASNKGDPGGFDGSKGDPPLVINAGVNLTQLPQKEITQSNLIS